jgi:hypothetical protein
MQQAYEQGAMARGQDGLEVFEGLGAQAAIVAANRAGRIAVEA